MNTIVKYYRILNEKGYHFLRVIKRRDNIRFVCLVYTSICADSSDAKIDFTNKFPAYENRKFTFCTVERLKSLYPNILGVDKLL